MRPVRNGAQVWGGTLAGAWVCEMCVAGGVGVCQLRPAGGDGAESLEVSAYDEIEFGAVGCNALGK